MFRSLYQTFQIIKILGIILVFLEKMIYGVCLCAVIQRNVNIASKFKVLKICTLENTKKYLFDEN